MKKILILVLSLCIALSFAGCSDSFTSEDAKLLVQGNIDTLYRGIYSEEYLESVKTTKEECEADRIDGIETSVDFFKSYFSINELTKAEEQKIFDMYDKLYQNSKFEITGVERTLNDFTLKVKVYPIDFFTVLIDDEFIQHLNDLSTKYADAQPGTMEYLTLCTKWNSYILTSCDELFATYETSYLDPVEIDMKVSINKEHNSWMIENASMIAFDTYVIAY